MRKSECLGTEKLNSVRRFFPVINTKFGKKIGMLICYDVEFRSRPGIEALKGVNFILFGGMEHSGCTQMGCGLAGNALFNLMFMAGSNPVETIAAEHQRLWDRRRSEAEASNIVRRNCSFVTLT